MGRHPRRHPRVDTGVSSYQPYAPPAQTCYRHPDRQTGVHCSRCDRPICPDCMSAASVGFQCPECVAEGRRTTRVARTRFGGRMPSRAGTVTYVLIGINVAVFLVTSAAAGGAALGFGGGTSRLFYDLALVPGGQLGDGTVFQGVAEGQYYRLLTSIFLHFGILHIAFNMYALYLLGPQLEQALGRARYLALYILAGLGGSTLSYLLGPQTEVAAGASGAIFGLFGAYYLVARRMGADTTQILVLLGINLVLSFTLPGIDVRGHIGGLLAGLAVGAALVYAPRARRTLVQVAAPVGVLVVLVALVVLRTAQIG